ncbi:hypothetical protein BH09SUM1_BH09SUM1_11930 [soil metagenome]
MLEFISWDQSCKLLAVTPALWKLLKRFWLLGERMPIPIAVRSSLGFAEDRIQLVGETPVACLPFRIHDFSGKPVEVGLRTFGNGSNQPLDYV